MPVFAVSLLEQVFQQILWPWPSHVIVFLRRKSASTCSDTTEERMLLPCCVLFLKILWKLNNSSFLTRMPVNRGLSTALSGRDFWIVVQGWSSMIMMILDWSRSASSLLRLLCELSSSGHRGWQMVETGEDDVRGPVWEVQVRFCLSACWPFFSAQNLTANFILTKPESGRPQRGWRGKSTLHLMVSASAVNFFFFFVNFVKFAVRQPLTHFACRCRDHSPTEADAPQRLRGDGEAVPPTFGLLHFGVSCRSDVQMFSFLRLLWFPPTIGF